MDFSVVAICDGRVQIVPGVSLDKSAADWDALTLGWRLVRPRDVVIHEPTIHVQIDYPLQHPTVVTLHGDVAGAFTRRHLLKSLQAEYSRIYEEEQAVDPAPDRRAQARAAKKKGCTLTNRWVGAVHEQRLSTKALRMHSLCACAMAVAWALPAPPAGLRCAACAHQKTAGPELTHPRRSTAEFPCTFFRSSHPAGPLPTVRGASGASTNPISSCAT